jgi:hypothetical protein
MAAPKVFISYSHDDAVWKERILTYLHPLGRNGAAEFWDPGSLESGTDWARQIETAVRQSDIVVLLISPSFLTSDFIMLTEFPEILERHHKEGIAVVPILVRPMRHLTFRR